MKNLEMIMVYFVIKEIEAVPLELNLLTKIQLNQIKELIRFIFDIFNNNNVYVYIWIKYNIIYNIAILWWLLF